MLASKRKTVKWGKTPIDGSNNPNFSGGKYIDDKGYVRVLCPDHPFNNAGYIYEHRLVIEKKLGRYLESWETIHHINEIKIDNRCDNLFLTTPPEHSSLHREGKRKDQAHKKKLRKVGKNRTHKRVNGKFVAETPPGPE